MGGYTVRSLLWTNAVSHGTQSEWAVNVAAPGLSLFPDNPIIVPREGSNDPHAGGLKPWPDAVWVQMSATIGSIRTPIAGTRAAFAIRADHSVIAMAEFMSAVDNQRGSVCCNFARTYPGQFFRGKDIMFDVVAGWHQDGSHGPFAIERGDVASTNLIVSIYEIVAF